MYDFSQLVDAVERLKQQVTAELQKRDQAHQKQFKELQHQLSKLRSELATLRGQMALLRRPKGPMV